MAKVLVVDDMAICREPVAEVLRAHSHTVVCSSSGEEALTLLREDRPDLILLDVTMPGLDGLSVLRTIRRNPNTKSIPVLLLTDKADKACIQDAAGIGVQGYLLKSRFSLTELLSRVDNCLAAPVGASIERRTSQTAVGVRTVERARGQARRTVSRGPTSEAEARVAVDRESDEGGFGLCADIDAEFAEAGGDVSRLA